MQTHPHLKTWIAILIAFLLFSFIPYKILIVTYAQAEAPFLVSPFYGRKNVNSWFDHELPNYGTTGSILRYDGIRRTNTDKTTCLTDNIDYNCYDGHNGLDFDLNYEPVLAAGDGYVTFAGWETGYEHYREYGLHINIRHEVYGDYYLTNYGHLSSVAVKQGEYVKAGQVIGTSGSNGASSGRHLHFDVSLLKNGEYLPVDPFGWQPVSNADVQDDPWENYAVNGNYGARSWCMWKAGQFASYCNPNANDQPLNELRALSEEIIDDGEVTFSKGYGGFNLNQCVGVDPLCRNWYESNAGVGNHTFRTFADGLQGVYETVDNWARWERTTFSEGTYDIYITVPDVVIYQENPDDNDTFTWQAKYNIRDCNGNLYENRIVDEYIGLKPDGNGGWMPETNNPYDKWLNIGTYCFSGTSYVYLTDVTGENRLSHCEDDGHNDGWCRLTSDAVRFVKRGYMEHLPMISSQPTSTATWTVTPIATPTRTPTPMSSQCTVGEPNNSFETAINIPLNGYYYYYICPSGDEDWFKFYVASDGMYRDIDIFLSSLPANYDLELFTPSQLLFRSSTNSGTSDEHIDVNDTDIGGSWRILVKGNGAFSENDSYAIRVTVSNGILSPPYPAP